MVTRLAEQGFNIQLNEAPTMTHKHGFEAQLIQKEGLYFMRAEMIHLSRKEMEAGQLGGSRYSSRDDTSLRDQH